MIARPHLVCRWLSINRARLYLSDHHRHLPTVTGAILAIGCYDQSSTPPRLCGILLLGRPIARLGDDGETADVTRCATDGTPNAGSALYARARRVCQALGLKGPHTHTLPEESGASLRGAGWVELEPTKGGEWSRDGRERAEHLPGVKRRWVAP